MVLMYIQIVHILSYPPSFIRVMQLVITHSSRNVLLEQIVLHIFHEGHLFFTERPF